MTDLRFLKDADVDTVAQLVFELAAQLHAERNRRLALEHALVAKGVVQADELNAVDDAERRSQAQAGLDRSLAGLLRIIGEHGPPEHPLRDSSDRAVPVHGIDST